MRILHVGSRLMEFKTRKMHTLYHNILYIKYNICIKIRQYNTQVFICMCA